MATRHDSSYSKNYLTTRNHSGPQLLRSIRGRVANAPSQTASPESSSRRMDTMLEEDIMALPQSSDEEEEPHVDQTEEPDIQKSGKRKAEDTVNGLPRKKRARNEQQPVRTSKRKAPVSEPEPEPEPISSSARDESEFLFSSQSSQRRRQKQYGRVNSYLKPESEGPSFQDPGEAPATPRKRKGGSFKAPDEVPGSRKRTPAKKHNGVDIPSSPIASIEKPAAFKLPDEGGLPASSSISTELSNIFEAEDVTEIPNRKRASSSSSLSSLDSIASYEMTEKQKAELGNGVALQAPVPKGSVRCPLCLCVVDLSTYPSKIDPLELPLRKQQIFCHTHKTKDANTTWIERDYPKIDWTALEKKRISKHLPHLRSVLYRKSPSFYLDHLDTKLKELKGNKSKTQKYLANDIVEFVKTGYYGPKGAKVMGNNITIEMANHLKRSLKVDQTVRTVGVSGFVSAVLLPELLQQVVMDDMKVSDEEKARQIVSDSTDMGILLWPDDDHVNRDDDADGN